MDFPFWRKKTGSPVANSRGSRSTSRSRTKNHPTTQWPYKSTPEPTSWMMDRSHTRNGSLQIGIMATMGKETQNQLPSTQKPCHSVNLLKDFATQKHCNAWRNSIVAHNGTGPGENLLREALNEPRPGQHWFNWAANDYQSWNVHNSTQFNENTPLTPTKTSSTIVHAHLFSQQKFISHETTNPSIIPPFILRIGPAKIQQNIHFN